MIFLIFQFLPKKIKMIRLSYVCLFFFKSYSFLSGKGLFVPKQTQVSFCKYKWLRLGRRAVITG